MPTLPEFGPLTLWIFTWAFAARSGRVLFAQGIGVWRLGQDPIQLSRALEHGRLAVLGFRELLQSGVSPASAQWDFLSGRLDGIAPGLIEDLRALRSSGAAVVPTLLRMERLLARLRKRIESARIKAAQARAQGAAATALVAINGLLLHAMLPEIGEIWGLGWWAVVALAVSISGTGMAWIGRMASQAVHGGLPSERQADLLAVPVFLESVQSRVRGGAPVDLAWSESARRLHAALREEVGTSLWDAVPSEARETARSLRAEIAAFGPNARAGLQAALMEGRGVSDRLDALAEGFHLKVDSAIDRELETLPVRALRPLFATAFPAFAGVVGMGLGSVLAKALAE